LISLALVFAPLVAALVAFLMPDGRRRFVLPVIGTIQLALTTIAIAIPETTGYGWLALDALGRVVLGYTTLVYFLCSLYAPSYLHHHRDRNDRIFVTVLSVFAGMIALHVQSKHIGLTWVALESLTLTCGPLVYFNRNQRSLEAVWKYLLIGSVGIALALLGSFFLGYAALQAGLDSSLLFDDLIRDAPKLSKPWLEAAFVLLFVGYGTKMGLAPMHTWKPDAYGEAPGLVGTLLAGCVTSCAYLAILRFYQITRAAGDVGLARETMIGVGLLSMVIAGAFMTRQRDYKRMLAYSSVEHMGILVLAIGIGGTAIFGGLLHLINNGLTKGVLFLSAGNIHRVYQSKLTSDVRGAIRRVPVSGALFLAGFFAVTGSPPFGVFLSELTILREAIVSGQYVVAALFLSILMIIFIGMGATVLDVVQGAPPTEERAKEPLGLVLPIAAFLGFSLLLGLYLPPSLEALLRDAAAYLDAAPVAGVAS
jgi:hydrogenase-4 component F